MKELLADNVALLKRIQEVNASINLQAITSTSKLRKITDPLTLTYCMLSFLAVKVPHPEARQIIAYMQIVIDLARKHPGPGWLSYHALFRQQMNAGGSSRWNELNTSLMATTVLSTQGGENGKFCQSCMATDHVQADCSLLLLDSNLANARQVSGPTRNQPRRPFQSAPYPSQRAPVGEPCQQFNRGICLSARASMSTLATLASGVTTQQSNVARGQRTGHSSSKPRQWSSSQIDR